MNAAGQCAPTLVVYPAKRLPSSIKTSMPPGPNWALGHSDKGCMNGEVFFEYMINAFIQWVSREKIKLRIIVFCDGHRSHMTYKLCTFCGDKEIELIALHPNATHILQPLDVSIFRPLKINWTKCVHEWKMDRARKDGEVLTKYNFAPFLKTAFDKTFEGQSVLNGFRACGLYPLDPDAVDYTKCDGARCNKPVAKALPTAEVNGDENRRKEDCMKHLESFINPETLKSFTETYDLITPIWGGDTEAHDLYVVWKKMKDDCGSTPLPSSNKSSTTQVVQPSCSKQTPLLRPPTSGTDPLPNTPTPSCSNENHKITFGTLPVRSAEDTQRRDKLAKVLSPETSGENVPSPLKDHLFWPITPKTRETNLNKRNIQSVRRPLVLTSEEWIEMEKKKIDEKKKKEERKREEKRKGGSKSNNGSKMAKKTTIHDIDEDWVCKKCQVRYSAEVITNKKRRWVDCDQCKSAFHVNCIPKSHLNLYGLDDDEED